MTRDYTQGGGLAAIGDGVTTLYNNLHWAAHGAPMRLSLHDAAGEGGTVNWVQTFNNRLWPAWIMAGQGITEQSNPLASGAVLLGLDYTPANNGGRNTYEPNGNILDVSRFLRNQAGAALGTMPFA